MNSIRLKITVIFGAFISCVDLLTIPSTVEFATGHIKLIFLSQKMFSFEKAHLACKELDAELARVDSQILFDAVERLSTTAWDGDWGDAWINLRWVQKQLVWGDNCQPVSHDWPNLTDDPPGTDSEARCYIIGKDYKWDLKNCGDKKHAICAKTSLYDGIPVSSYERIDSGFVAVNVSSDGTQPDVTCKELCDKVLGCYLTSSHKSGCILSIVHPNATSYFKVMDITGETHTFSDDITDHIDEITEGHVLDIKRCQVELPPRNDTDYVDVEQLDPLEMDPVSTKTETDTETVQSSCPMEVWQTAIRDKLRTRTIYAATTITESQYATISAICVPATTTVTDISSAMCVPATTTVTDIPSAMCVPATTTVTDISSAMCVPATTTVTDISSAMCVPATTTVTETPSLASVLITTLQTIVTSSCSSEVTPLVLKMSSCFDSSPFPYRSRNISEEETDAIKNSIIKELEVDTRSTFKYLSKFTSAPDSRVSAQAVGFVSISFICFVFFLILALDAPNMYFYVTRRTKADNDESAFTTTE